MKNKPYVRFDCETRDKNDFVRAAKARGQTLGEWCIETLGNEYAQMVVTGEIPPRAIKKNRTPYKPGG